MICRVLFGAGGSGRGLGHEEPDPEITHGDEQDPDQPVVLAPVGPGSPAIHRNQDRIGQMENAAITHVTAPPPEEEEPE
jgi:hypothetical protein